MRQNSKVKTLFKRMRFAVTIEERAECDASKITNEVIAHQVSLVKTSGRVTEEIETDIPNGTPDNTVRLFIENGQTMKFTSLGFEVGQIS